MTTLHAPTPAPVRNVPSRGLRWSPIAAVVHREWRVFRRVWRSLMFGSVVEPLVYLLAFGFGFGGCNHAVVEAQGMAARTLEGHGVELASLDRLHVPAALQADGAE